MSSKDELLNSELEFYAARDAILDSMNLPEVEFQNLVQDMMQNSYAYKRALIAAMSHTDLEIREQHQSRATGLSDQCISFIYAVNGYRERRNLS